jgi:hypothetical protein
MGRKRGRWVKGLGWIVVVIVMALGLLVVTHLNYYHALKATGWDFQLAQRLELSVMPVFPDELDYTLQGKPPWFIATQKWLCRKKLFGAYIGPTHKSFKLNLDRGEPALDVGSAPYGAMLHDAAVDYALATRDYQVQLRELVDGGYIPFVQPVAGFDSAAVVCGEPGTYELLSATDLMRMQDCTHQILEKNNRIQWFLSGYAAICKDGSASVPRVVSLMELDPSAKFWINPYTGAPMQEAWTQGDYVMLDSESINGNLLYQVSGHLPRGIKVPYILPDSRLAPMLEGNGLLVLTPKPGEKVPSAPAAEPVAEGTSAAEGGAGKRRGTFTFTPH